LKFNPGIGSGEPPRYRGFPAGLGYPDGISVDMGNKAGNFRGFSLFFTQINPACKDSTYPVVYKK
jgi:hypothetical protein